MLVISDEVYKYMVYSNLKLDDSENLNGAAAVAAASPITAVSGSVNDQNLMTGTEPLPALRHIHFATLEGMWDRTITISSAGKTFSVTGWQVSMERGFVLRF